MRYRLAKNRRNRRQSTRLRRNSSSTGSRSEVVVCQDNVHVSLLDLVANSFSSATTANLESIGITDKNNTDDLLVAQYCNTYPETVHKLLVTKDRSSASKDMDRVIAAQQVRGQRISLMSIPAGISKAEAEELVSRFLATNRKNRSMLLRPGIIRVHVSSSGSNLEIRRYDAQGKEVLALIPKSDWQIKTDK